MRAVDTGGESASGDIGTESESTVEARTADLEGAVKELASFSHAVSHDLRQPLRTIDGFLHLLEEDLQGRIDEGSAGHMERVRGGVRKMDCLIDDLLQLSRVGAAQLARDRVDLSSLAASIAAGLRASAPEREVSFEIERNVTAYCDPGLAHLLLQNLMANAWKFTARKPRPVIEFAEFTDEDGESVYLVRDDGVGFDQAFAGKLFGTFTRLHSDDEFEGTGIGLSTVERIVKRHGGRIWGEGQIDKGATFCFTLGTENRNCASVEEATPSSADETPGAGSLPD